MRKFTPPEYSVVDSLGNRTLLLDIDIMMRMVSVSSAHSVTRLLYVWTSRLAGMLTAKRCLMKLTRLIHISKNATTCASVSLMQNQ